MTYFNQHMQIQKALSEGVPTFFQREPPSARHLNGVDKGPTLKIVSKYWLGSFVVFQGIRATIVKEPDYIGDRQRGVKYDLMHPTDGFVNHILK